MELQETFVQQLQALLPDEWNALVEAITSTAPSVSVRVNAARGVTPPSGASLVPWCPIGFYCAERPAFTFDPDFHGGRYYVQDASSMFVYHVLRQLVNAPVRYLDLCAAPGGKTTAAIDALPVESLVVANEIVTSRARVLRDNVVKWGSAHTVVTNNAPADYGRLTDFFDVIATDVPCSGEGMMRKDAEAVAQWTPALVQECAARQQTIIDDVWPALKPGGLLLYSTCTYNRYENEMMVESIIERYGAEPVTVDIEPSWNIHPAIGSTVPAYRFMPHLTQGEGLFMAVLRKPLNAPSRPMKSKKAKPMKNSVLPKGVDAWLKNADDYQLSLQGNEVVAMPKCLEQEMVLLGASLNVLHAGVTLGTLKGKNCVPAHSLALSTELNTDAFAQVELDDAMAMAFLRGESIVVDAARGYVLVTHRGAPLGWVNNLGNRANNLYPKSLRILSSHLPDVLPSLI